MIANGSIREYDVIYKVLLIGESGVGKTAMIQRYKNPDLKLPNYLPTIGIDFRLVDLVVDGLKVRVQLWDTVGQERYRTMTTNFFRGANGILLLYDVTDPESFTLVANWIIQLKEKDLDEEEVFIIGNKIDLADRCISYKEGKNFAASYGFKYYETSAKTGENVDEVIQNLVNNIKDAKHPLEERNLVGKDGTSTKLYLEYQKKDETVNIKLKEGSKKKMSKPRKLFKRFCKV